MNKSKEDILKELGSNIKRRRQELGITQKELGLRINKDQQSINRIETGGINPTYFQLLEISKGLGIDVSELVKFETNK